MALMRASPIDKPSSWHGKCLQTCKNLVPVQEVKTHSVLGHNAMLCRSVAEIKPANQLTRHSGHKYDRGAV